MTDTETRPERSRGIDALRGTAALAVLVMHAGLLPHGHPRPPATFWQHVGWGAYWNLDIGVDLFFVLSGYLIAGPYVRALVAGRPLPARGRYALRRAARVLPGYWVAFAAITLWPWFPSHWWVYVLHTLLLMNPVPGQLQTGLPVAWTLHVEVAFYLLVPLAAAALRRRHPLGLHPRRLARIVLALMAASAVAAFAASLVPMTSPWWRPATMSIPACIGLFGPGILLALARTPEASLRWPRGPARRLARGPAAGVAALAATAVVVAVAATGPGGLPVVYRPLRAFVAVLLVARLTRPGAKPGVAVRVLAPLGTVSYGIYLWHFVIQRDLTQFGWWYGATGRYGLAVDALVLFALTMPFAIASWWLVERPLLSLAAGRRGAAGAPASPATTPGSPATRRPRPAPQLVHRAP